MQASDEVGAQLNIVPMILRADTTLGLIGIRVDDPETRFDFGVLERHGLDVCTHFGLQNAGQIVAQMMPCWSLETVRRRGLGILEKALVM